MKKYLIVFFVAIVLFFASPSKSMAQLAKYFGGHVYVQLYCTCSQNYWLFMTPLYLNSSVPTVGALIWSPLESVAYKNNVNPPTPMTWLLGEYRENAGLGCEMIAGPACIEIPSLGTIRRSGISYPGM